MAEPGQNIDMSAANQEAVNQQKIADAKAILASTEADAERAAQFGVSVILAFDEHQDWMSESTAVEFLSLCPMNESGDVPGLFAALNAALTTPAHADLAASIIHAAHKIAVETSYQEQFGEDVARPEATEPKSEELNRLQLDWIILESHKRKLITADFARRLTKDDDLLRRMLNGDIEKDVLSAFRPTAKEMRGVRATLPNEITQAQVLLDLARL